MPDLNIGDLSTLDCSGAWNSLVYDPETHSVWTHGNVGNGQPSEIYYRRQITVAGVPQNCLPDHLRKAIQSCSQVFDEIYGLYEGTERDENGNLRGRWSDEDRLRELAGMIGDALEDLPEYCDAWWFLSEGFFGPEDCIGRAVAENNGELTAWADALVDEAANEGLYLHADELLTALRGSADTHADLLLTLLKEAKARTVESVLRIARAYPVRGVSEEVGLTIVCEDRSRLVLPAEDGTPVYEQAEVKAP